MPVEEFSTAKQVGTEQRCRSARGGDAHAKAAQMGELERRLLPGTGTGTGRRRSAWRGAVGKA